VRSIPTGAVALAAIASLGAVGCGGDDDNEKSSSKTSETTGGKVGAPGATVSFVAPKEGAAVSGRVKARVKLSGFTLDPKAVGKKPVEGHGHLHFSLDGGKYDHPKYSGANGKLAVQLGVDGKYSPSVTPTIVYSNLPEGKHELEVYLANNDHSDTGVEARTEFTVSAKSASAESTLPVAMKDIKFDPEALSATVGQTIEWTNEDTVDHNVTATEGEEFKSKAFGKGGTFSYTLDKPGKVTYVCTLHPGMTGTITVTK
jgi:plastocyanin